MKKKFMAFALVTVILVGLLPMTAIAAPVSDLDGLNLIPVENLSENEIDSMTNEELLENGYVMPYDRDADFYVENYQKPVENDRMMSASDLTAYSSVEQGRITAARNQGNYGTCWAFGATAAAEATLIENSTDYTTDNTDLSELQLVYSFYNDKYDPLGNASGDATSYTSDDNIMNAGGNNSFTIWALAGWTNGAPESALSYTDANIENAKNKTIDISSLYSQNIAHLQNALVIPYSDYYENVQEVKEAIVQYGCLSTSIGYESQYYKSATGLYYNPNSDTNHVISVVGWNDSVPASSFTVTYRGVTYTPEGDGAWLVRNSYGSSWGTDGDSDYAKSGSEGYFWVSYFDASLLSAAKMYVYDFESADTYKYNYQYDGSNGNKYYSSSSGSSFAATYTVKGLTSDTERVDAVGFGTISAGLNYSVQIYKNPANPGQPNSGEALLDTPVTGHTTYAGYYTIRIPNGPVLSKGDTYSVVITLTATQGNTVSCATDESYQNGTWISFTADTSDDITWLATPGGSFSKLTSETARIKAYTNDGNTTKITSITLSNTPSELEIGKTQQVTALYEPDDAGESIIWSSTDSGVASVNASGMVTGVGEGTATITASSVSGGASASFEVTVVYPSVNVSLQKGETKNITDETGYYVSSYTGKYLDSSIATVSVSGKNVAGVPATDPTVTEMSSFKTGNYIIGVSGKYIKVSGTTIGETSDPTQATVFTLSGNSSSATLKYNSYYLVHSTSGISLSTSSSNASWKYSSNRFYFSTSRRVWFWTTTTTYYLTYNSGFTVKTSSSNAVNASTYTAGTPAVPEEIYTTIAITGVKAGTTKVLVGDTVYNITVTGSSTPETKTLKVYSNDDLGVKVADTYEISGTIGTSYTVIPAEIADYVTPDTVTGTYAENSEDITLVYNLKAANKSALQTLINNKVQKGNYTDSSYSAYETAYTNGQTIYNKSRAKQSEVDAAVLAINNAISNLTEKVAAVLTVKVQDELGVKIADDYQVNGYIGDSYTVTPKTIYGYTSPQAVTGKFTAATQTVTLKYTLNTNKSALKALLDSPVAKGHYTDDSYETYQNALNAGQLVYDNARATQTEVDSAVSTINTAKDNLTLKAQKTINIYYVDDAGATIKTKTQITGYVGDSYTVTPEAIYGYTTPSAVTGTYATNSEDITLRYTLNTDKTTLKNLLDNPVAKGNYTDDSYATYQDALNDGQTVYSKARATQTEVDAAVNTINTAKSNLKLKATDTYTLDTDSINSGSEYIIVCSGMAMGVTNGSITAKSVSVASNTIGSIDSNYVWIISGSSSSYTLRNKATGQYLVMNSSGSWFSRTRSLGLSSSSYTWSVTTSGSNKKFYSSSFFSKYYITYSSGFKLSSSSKNLQLYKKNS